MEWKLKYRNELGVSLVSKIKSGDRCVDCKHCKVWNTDHRKASCNLFNDQGFHPDRPVPASCVNKVERSY